MFSTKKQNSKLLLMSQTQCASTTRATVGLRTPYSAKINLHTCIDCRKICTTVVHNVYLLKISKTDPEASSRRSAIDTLNPPRQYYSSNYRSTNQFRTTNEIRNLHVGTAESNFGN